MSSAPYCRSPELLSAATSRLLIVDMQEKFLPTIPQPEGLIANCVKLIRGAAILGVPVSATEQYPKGLGPTIPELLPLLPERPAKLRFSCAECLDWAEHGGRSDGRHQIVLAGIEAHVCVLQTSLDLLAAGFDVFVAADAVRSRSDVDRDIALRRLSDSGARLITAEMALFEWCEAAGTDQFKQISKLITGR
jgi:nicotinamidase-related amidase